MEEELARLQSLVTQLQADNKRMRQEQAQPGTSTSASSTAPGGSSANFAVTERLIYLPRDRKCPIFRGRTGLDINEWREEVEACLRSRHLSPTEQALFIFDHLEGEAREEIRYRPVEEREDPDKILAILQELYDCTKSYVCLQEEFFSRKQFEGETLQEFSHGLLCLMDKVVKKAPTPVLNKEVLLRDQFVEHVSDCALRRALKQYVRSRPTATLIEVRTEAIAWEQEGMPMGGRARSFSVPSAFGFQHAVRGVSPQATQPKSTPQNSELSELKEMLKSQQEQLNNLTRSLAELSKGPRQQSNLAQQVICRRCQQPGHFARHCTFPYGPPPAQASRTGFPNTSSDRSLPTQQGNFHPLNH